MTSISVVIPTYNAGNQIAVLIEKLLGQTIRPMEIIIVDSESTDETESIVTKYPEVRFIKIAKKDFDHGGTRDMAIRECKGEYVVMMVQDALPADEFLFENLVAPLISGEAQASMARQVAYEDATLYEKLVREFNYPDEDRINSLNDLDERGIKTFFFSDVCACYSLEIYKSIGGFERPIKTNEDMFFAAELLRNGHCTAYVSKAVVYHSHNLTLKQQFMRNYKEGYEIKAHAALLMNAKSIKQGGLLARYVFKELINNNEYLLCIRFFFDLVARFLGNRMGILMYFFKN